MVPPSFKSVAARLEDLISGGHRQNETLILEEIGLLAEGNLALREYIRLASKDIKKRQLFGAQSFLLYTGPSYLMRLNLWFPHSAEYERKATERYERFLSIGICHNHNFDFFTVGLFGPGYKSTYYHSSSALQSKSEGDIVEFDREWDVAVPAGKTMFVRRFEDFHIQYCPESLSMTLNIIPHAGRDASGRQYVLQEKTWRIEHVLISDLDADRPDPDIQERLRSFARFAGIDLENKQLPQV